MHCPHDARMLPARACHRYFGALLPSVYWVGYVREAAPPDGVAEWVALDGRDVDQYPNNGVPYSHWSWNHYSRWGLSCTMFGGGSACSGSVGGNGM
jgi:hypothetical protein